MHTETVNYNPATWHLIWRTTPEKRTIHLTATKRNAIKTPRFGSNANAAAPLQPIGFSIDPQKTNTKEERKENQTTDVNPFANTGIPTIKLTSTWETIQNCWCQGRWDVPVKWILKHAWAVFCNLSHRQAHIHTELYAFLTHPHPTWSWIETQPKTTSSVKLQRRAIAAAPFLFMLFPIEKKGVRANCTPALHRVTESNGKNKHTWRVQFRQCLERGQGLPSSLLDTVF